MHLVTKVLEFVHDGDKSVAELIDIGRQLLGRRQVLRTVPHLIDSVQVKGTFPDVPSLEIFPIIEGDKIPGERILRNGHILLNSGREAITLNVTNDGDRPIQVAAIIISLSGGIIVDGSPLAYKTTREAYANIYGPTVRDKIRLGDTNLFMFRDCRAVDALDVLRSANGGTIELLHMPALRQLRLMAHEAFQPGARNWGRRLAALRARSLRLRGVFSEANGFT
nr:urease isoform X1 [Tanacetum cinerariifolium]